MCFILIYFKSDTNCSLGHSFGHIINGYKMHILKNSLILHVWQEEKKHILPLYI